jgi:replication factor C subunit 3/5
MFLVDKYQKDCNYITCHQDLIEKLLDTFDSHQDLYRKVVSILKDGKTETSDGINKDLCELIIELETQNWRYSNLQHLVVYGPKGCGKEYIVENFLKKIYGNIETNDIEYTITGYSNTKEKVMIKQSKYHILIEPNNNGFDKYLIQEIIQEYAKAENLSIFKYKKLFKVVVINKIDNLSYSAQASLRRTMEKYADICKFIFICDQLSKVIEPLRSRCLLIRVPLPTKNQIIESLLQISYRENIDISIEDYNKILDNSDYQVNNAIWMLEAKRYGVENNSSWIDIIKQMVNSFFELKNINSSEILSFLKKIREYFYILFITNLDIKKILNHFLTEFISKVDDLNLKFEIINIISEYEVRICEGTRYIVHVEAMMIKLLRLLYSSKVIGL